MKKIINFISNYKYVFLVLILVAEFAGYFFLEQYYSLVMKSIDVLHINNSEVDMSAITLAYEISSNARILILYLFAPLVGYCFLNPILSKVIKNRIVCTILCVFASLVCILLFSDLVIANIAMLIVNHKFSLGNVVSKITSSFIGSFRILVGFNAINGLKNIPGETDLQTIKAVIFELIYVLPLIETILLIIKKNPIEMEEVKTNEN